MKPTLLSLFLLFTLNLTKSSAQISLTARQIIDKSIEATGGQQYLQSIRTLYTNMATEMEARKVNWITKEMLPNKGSFQIVYQDRIVFANFYDGENGYEVTGGKKQLADQAEFSDKKIRRNIFNELDYLDSTLYTLTVLGTEKVDKEDCHKVKATCINGAVRILYYSKKTFLMLREDKFTTEKGGFSTTYFSGYKKYGKLTYYTDLVFGEGEKMQKATIVELLANEKISDDDFR
ncbi:hypothetical protein [Pedobacter sp. L105]|uniref:hypothetical protein n=1 Tax=Pedobacter sp. L105 TaxID=1641871 RepID=UPI00131ED0D0|nr:hypothetical protein [Pedobacter sp. L105]